MEEAGRSPLSHKPAGCPITFLLWLLFPASPPGPPASVLPPETWHAGGHLERMLFPGLPGSWLRGGAGAQTFLDCSRWAGQGV